MLINTVNIVLDQFSQWFKANKLSLNVKNFILFRSKHKSFKEVTETKTDNITILQVMDTKFL